MKYAPKTKNVDADVIRFVKQNEGRVVLYTASVESVLRSWLKYLQVNGVKAVPYHAGLDV